MVPALVTTPTDAAAVERDLSTHTPVSIFAPCWRAPAA